MSVHKKLQRSGSTEVIDGVDTKVAESLLRYCGVGDFPLYVEFYIISVADFSHD
jgi:hypothetical protein